MRTGRHQFAFVDALQAFQLRSDLPRLAGARGRRGGRPRIKSEEAKVLAAKRLAGDKSIQIDDICKTLNISRSTYSRYLAMKSNDSPEIIG